MSLTVVPQDERLWEGDAHSGFTLLFSGVGTFIKLSAKGRLLVRDTSGEYYEAG